LKEAQYRQKSYADKNKTTREFKVEEHVLLKVNPKKSLINLGSYTKLAARLCSPFEILEIIGPVAYMLAFPASMNTHNVFHVSLMNDPNHVIDWNFIQVHLEGDF
jgi:hypothetical protein